MIFLELIRIMVQNSLTVEHRIVYYYKVNLIMYNVDVATYIHDTSMNLIQEM